MKPREAREAVLFPVRIKLGGTWSDACIRNASSRGVMLQLPSPPERGSFVEIRRADMVIVGQVRWTQGDRCGVRTQDRVPMGYLKSGNPLAEPTRAGAAGAVERRAAVRTISPEEAAERSRMRATLFQNVAMGAAGIAGALVLAMLVHDSLRAPFEAVIRHLG